MSIFSKGNFGLTDSLINAVKTVTEGKQKYRVSAQKGSLAARFLKDAETTLFARDEKDAANRVMADFKMKGVSQNDLKITAEEFVPGDELDLHEVKQDSYSVYDPKAKKVVATGLSRSAAKKKADDKGLKFGSGPWVQDQMKESADLQEAPKRQKMSMKDWEARITKEYSDVAFNEKDGGKRIEAIGEPKGGDKSKRQKVGEFVVDKPPAQSHKRGVGFVGEEE